MQEKVRISNVGKVIKNQSFIIYPYCYVFIDTIVLG